MHEHERSLPGPRDNEPNGVEPGVNLPPTTTNPPGDYNPVSVGPDASDGFGNTHTTDLGVSGWGSPVDVQAWSGWPDQWATPLWGSGSQTLLGPLGHRVDVVFECLDLNASILSTMPPYILRGSDPQPDKTWLTNPEPELYVSWAAFAKELFWCYRGVGEAFVYALARGSDGFPSRFMVLNPSVVTVDRLGSGALRYTVAGSDVDPADILHIKYASWPGDLRGHGSLEVAGARLLTVAALTKYATGLAEAGGLPPAVIKYPRRVNRKQISQIQTDWLRARVSGMGLPAVLADGVELQEIGGQLHDAALAELSKFSEARIANLLGVPPFLIGLPSSDVGTYVNSTNVFDFHWRAYLRPEAYSVTKALSGWLLPRGWGVELNRDEYVRPSLIERAQAYQMMIGSQVMTPDEARVIERLAGPAGAQATSGAQTTGAPAAEAAQAEAPTVTPTENPVQGPGRPVQTNA